MLKSLRQAADLMRLMPQGGPSVCNIAVTNLCNATCDFCSFAYDKGLVTDRRYIDAERFREANATMRQWQMKSVASVTINKLIGDFRALPPFLRDLGFDTVTFSYPKRARLGTSSLVYSETSSLIDYTPDELAAAFAEVQ